MHLVGKNRPEFVMYGVREMRKFYIMNVNVTETGDGFEWDVVTTNPGDMDYGELVSGYIRLKYSDDAMIAVINNYLNDMTDEQRAEEFREMQNWRSAAKEVSKSAIKWAAEHSIYEPTEENEWIISGEDEIAE